MNQRTLWTLLVLLVPVAGVGSFVWAYQEGYWFPEDLSKHGAAIDRLFAILLCITGVVFVGTQLLLAAAVWRFGSRQRREVWYTHGDNRLEWTWTFFFGAILAGLAVYQMESWAASKMRRPDVAATAEIVGRQFNWDIRYPGPDNQLHTVDDVILTDGMLHVPVGEQILLLLTSKDVIHSFFVPQLRVKQDIVPGLDQAVWFTPRTKGECEIVCAELCGWGHPRMQGRLIVESRSDYEKFLAKAYAEAEAASIDRQGAQSQ